MMARPSDTPTQERAYQEIRRRLLSGAYRLRERLDATAIASDLGMSATPVREALLRLMAERLVMFRPARGFSVALWSESQLHHLYLWRGQLAQLALAGCNAAPLATGALPLDYPERVVAVLRMLHVDANSELVCAALNADDRLARARVAEQHLWPDVETEIATFANVIAHGARPVQSAAIEAFFMRRAQSAKHIRDRAVLLALPPNGA